MKFNYLRVPLNNILKIHKHINVVTLGTNPGDFCGSSSPFQIHPYRSLFDMMLSDPSAPRCSINYNNNRLPMLAYCTYVLYTRIISARGNVIFYDA